MFKLLWDYKDIFILPFFVLISLVFLLLVLGAVVYNIVVNGETVRWL